MLLHVDWNEKGLFFTKRLQMINKVINYSYAKKIGPFRTQHREVANTSGPVFDIYQYHWLVVQLKFNVLYVILDVHIYGTLLIILSYKHWFIIVL